MQPVNVLVTARLDENLKTIIDDHLRDVANVTYLGRMRAKTKPLGMQMCFFPGTLRGSSRRMSTRE